MIAINMSTRLYHWSWISSFVLISVLLLGACSKDTVTPQVHTSAMGDSAHEQFSNVVFPISGDLTVDYSEQPELRSLDASVGVYRSPINNPVTLPDTISVITIIRSSGSDPVTYDATLRAVKNATTSRYTVQADAVKLAAGSSIAAGKKWYVMFVAGGSYNPTTHKLSFDASAPEIIEGATITSEAKRSAMDFPMASAWVELPTQADGSAKPRKDWDYDAIVRMGRVAFYPLGVLCRATLTLNNDYIGRGYVSSSNSESSLAVRVDASIPTTVRIKELKLVTTAFSFKGDFDLSQLPAVTSVGRPTLRWTNTQEASGDKEFKALDDSVDEYVKIFRAGAHADAGVLSVSGRRYDRIFQLPDANTLSLEPGVEAILFWAMPTPGVADSDRHTSLIAESGTSSNARILAPSHTYIYGKKHGREARQGTTVYFNAVYYNPYTPLDYMAEHNVERKDPDQWYVGGMIPLGPPMAGPRGRLQLAVDQGRSSFTAVKHIEYPNGLLSLEDGRLGVTNTGSMFEAFIPYGHRGSLHNYDQIRVTLNPNDTRSADREHLLVHLFNSEVATTYYSARKKVGGPMYALALEGGFHNLHRVAYRYSLVPNPDVLVDQPGLQIPFTGRFFVAGLSDFKVNPVTRMMMKIEAIHLGPYFVGHVDDIALESFWNQPGVRKEVRYIPFVQDAITIPGRRNTSLDTSDISFYNRAFDASGRIPGFSFRDLSWKAYEAADFNPDGTQKMNNLRVSVRPITTQEHH